MGASRLEKRYSERPPSLYNLRIILVRWQLNRHRMSHSQSDSGSNNRPRLGKKSLGSMILVVLLGIYTFARPAINRQLGWDLPALSDSGQSDSGQGHGSDTDADRGSASQSGATREKTSNSVGSSSSRASEKESRDDAKFSPAKSRPSKSEPQKPGLQNSDQRELGQQESDAEPADDGLLYGLLREISPDRYLSPAGLQYTPGSAEGHRLEHLRRHTEDQPTRPGSHGVFDGGMEGALKTIDLAYEKAKKNTQTTTKNEGSRTVYTVTMGGRVGYVGGRSGNQRRKPMARRVVLVLDGNRVITAYPK